MFDKVDYFSISASHYNRISQLTREVSPMSYARTACRADAENANAPRGACDSNECGWEDGAANLRSRETRPRECGQYSLRM